MLEEIPSVSGPVSGPVSANDLMITKSRALCQHSLSRIVHLYDKCHETSVTYVRAGDERSNGLAR